MPMLTLRLRLPSGSATVQLDKEATFAALKEVAASKASAKEDGIVLSSGFPPTALALEGDARIADTLQNMDTVMVSLATASAGQAMSTERMGKLPVGIEYCGG